ncbi:MAG TPA: tRNA glutamyl-Q(34) synthetase GluQRS [Candidatus Saccharimonadia bacterium]|nr:tRNA glutamyl-Q(34) synthetase GluQRS [Candidatus Saccharimonadia bacterium]
MSSDRYRGRFAPSPTGDLHFGSLVTALGSWLRARSRGGAWIVRVEDLDPPREVPGAARRILDTLAAFGMQSDEPVVMQSTRTGHYDAAASRLVGLGAAFACRCSRSALAGALHHGCVAAAGRAARAASLRVRGVDAEICFDDLLQGRRCQNLARDVGDFVVRRGDGWFAYQLAVVVDDAAQGITEVVRGADLLDSTARQIHLQRLLGLPTPRYAHLPLVLDATRRKLGKQLRSAPVDPADPMPALKRALAFLGQDDPDAHAATTPALALAAAARTFSLESVPRADRVVASA